MIRFDGSRRSLPADPARKSLRPNNRGRAHMVQRRPIGQKPASPPECATLGDIARSRGMAMIAEQTGLAREALYNSPSANGNPRLTTLLGVLKARLGFGSQ